MNTLLFSLHVVALKPDDILLFKEAAVSQGPRSNSPQEPETIRSLLGRGGNMKDVIKLISAELGTEITIEEHPGDWLTKALQQGVIASKK